MWKQRFRCLRIPLRMHLENSLTVIVLTACLHNFAINNGDFIKEEPEAAVESIIMNIGAEFVILPGMRKVYDVKIETLPFDYVRYSEDEEINYILTTNHYIRCNPKFDSQMYKFFVTIVHMRAHLQVQSAIYHKIVA